MELKTLADLIELTKSEIELISIIKNSSIEQDKKDELLIRMFPYLAENLMLLYKNGLTYENPKKLESQYRLRNQIVHRKPYVEHLVLARLEEMIVLIEPKLDMQISEKILNMPIINKDKTKISKKNK